TGDEQEAIGKREELAPLLERVIGEAEFFQACRRVLGIDNPDQDLLPPPPRHGADAQLNGLSIEHDVDLSLLRAIAMSDVELREQLDARGDGGAHLERRTEFFGEAAIDAVADAQ